MQRIVQCVPVLARETLQARLDEGVKSGCILEMFCTDATGVHHPIRFTVSRPSEGQNGRRSYEGVTHEGHKMNIHLLDGGSKVNILET